MLIGIKEKIEVIKMRILFLTIIKTPNDLIDRITVDRNTNLTVFKFFMVGFKSFLTSDVGILPTIILNIGSTMIGGLFIPEKLPQIINNSGGSCFIIPDIPQTFNA